MAITKIGTPELFDFSATNTALQLPTGDTASRPSAPSAGEWRFNSQLKYVEYWDGGAWRQIDTEAPAVLVSNENFNVNTYFGNGATQTIDAKFNEAANYNGGSSYINIPNHPFDYTTMTFSAWLNPSVDNNFMYIFQNSLYHQSLGGSIGWYVRRNSGGALQARGFSSASLGAAEFDVTSASGLIPLNTWTNVVCVLTPTSFNIYINGNSTAVASATFSNAIRYSSGSYNVAVYLGVNYYFYGSFLYEAYWEGGMDQVRIFNTALTDAQVEDLYTDETTTTAATLDFPAGAGCQAAYQLDGNANDISTNYNGTTQNIGYTGLLFQPDLVWNKVTSTTGDHNLTDSVRGAQKALNPNLPSAEGNQSPLGITFLSNGFTAIDNSGGGASVNGSGKTYVAWAWKAGGAPTATNSEAAGDAPTPDSVMINGVSSTTALAGATPATNISANTGVGFSIVKYTGPASNSTIAHELGVTPSIIIQKPTSSGDWYVYIAPGIIDATSNYYYLVLNSDGTKGTTSSAAPTTTTFNAAGSGAHIAYCFADIAGYQKIGSYPGTGNAGIVVEVGFTPSFLLVKRTDSGGTSGARGWFLLDNKRNTSNPRNTSLEVQGNYQDNTLSSISFDFDATSFKVNGTNYQVNESGGNYLYLAIA